MRQARLLILLLVAATVLVDLVALSVLAYNEGFPVVWPHPALLVLYSLSLSQVSLAALWSGFGARSLPWRVMGLVLTIVFWGALVAAWVTPDERAELQTIWIVLLLAQTVGILVPLSIARLKGLKLLSPSTAGSTGQTVCGRPLLQFSLGYLLSWITAVAVVLGLLQYTVDYRFLLSILQHLWWEISVVSVGHAGLGLAALWAMLGTRRPALRTSVVALTTAAVIVAWKESEDADVNDLVRYAALCLLDLLWLVASLWVVRVAGYRVVRRPRAGLEQSPGPEGDG